MASGSAMAKRAAEHVAQMQATARAVAERYGVPLPAVLADDTLSLTGQIGEAYLAAHYQAKIALVLAALTDLFAAALDAATAEAPPRRRS